MTKESASVSELCDQIVLCLSNLDRPVAGKLNAGLPRVELERHQDKLGLRFSEELLELYCWRNGSVMDDTPLDDLYFLPWFYFCSIEEASSTYRDLVGESGWKRSWLPCFLSGGAGWLGVDCRGGQVLRWSAGARTVVQYLSIRSMLETVLECYQAGCFFVERGELQRRDEQFRQIGLRHNPGLEYWKNLPLSD